MPVMMVVCQWVFAWPPDISHRRTGNGDDHSAQAVHTTVSQSLEKALVPVSCPRVTRRW